MLETFFVIAIVIIVGGSGILAILVSESKSSSDRFEKIKKKCVDAKTHSELLAAHNEFINANSNSESEWHKEIIIILNTKTKDILEKEESQSQNH